MFACIVWTGETRSQLTTATRQQAPREMVAVLGGRVVDQTVHIDHVALLPNQATDDDSFAIDASQFARCETELRAAGHAFVGFAHSHPNGHATLSQRDVEQLWTDCVQVVTDGDAVHAFVLDRERIVHPVRGAAAAATSCGAPR